MPWPPGGKEASYDVTGGGNLFWAMFNFLASPGVPISLKKVYALADYHYSSGKKPGPPCMTLHVVLPANITREQPTQQLASGEMKVTTQLECLHAWLFAVKQALDNGASEVELRNWLQHALSADMTSTKRDSMDDIHFAAVQKREDLAANNKYMGRTALGRILEVAGFKARKERASGPLSAASIAVLYREHCKIVNPEEQVSENFIDNALTIQRRLISLDGVMTILLEAEDTCEPTAFNTISKLHAIVTKCKHPHLILWAVNYLRDDHIVHGPNGVPSVRDMHGRGPVVGKLDLLNFKHMIKQYILATWLDQSTVSSPTKESMRTSLSDHATYRSSNGFPTEEVDLSWKAEWSKGAATYYTIFEAACLCNARPGDPGEEPSAIDTTTEFGRGAQRWHWLMKDAHEMMMASAHMSSINSNLNRQGILKSS